MYPGTRNFDKGTSETATAQGKTPWREAGGWNRPKSAMIRQGNTKANAARENAGEAPAEGSSRSAKARSAKSLIRSRQGKLKGG